MLTFLIFKKSSCSVTLKVFTATRCPMCLPRLTSAKPPEPNIVFSTSIFPVIIMESGSRPWYPASFLKVTKNTCFSAGLRLCCAVP